MVNPPALPRATLLALSLLSSCAAGQPDALSDGAAHRPAPGASGAYLVGRHALGQTDFDTASTGFLRALAADPQNSELQQQAFGATVLTGRPESLALARQIPSNPAALLVLAGGDLRSGAWADAQARFASLPGQGLTQVLQPLLLAWSRQGGGDTDAALGTLRPFLEDSRYRGVFALHAALINDQAGRTDAAARLYAQALAGYGTLNLRLGTIVASWQARAGHEAEARATLRAMADTSPDLAIAEPALQRDAGQMQVASARDGIAEAYLALAASLQRQDAVDFSLLLLHLALDLKPGFTSARLLASDIQAGAGQLAGAVATLAPVTDADPLAAVVRLRQARLQGRLGHDAEAHRLLEDMAAQYPHDPEPLTALAGMQMAEGRFADAAGTSDRAIARVPQPGRAAWALFYQRGTAYDRAHDWARAEPDLLHALALSPDQPFVLNYLGYAWAEQGRNLPRARTMLERAVALRPGDGAILDSLGWVLLLQGDHDGAIHRLERAVELTPEDPTANGHLGDAYAAAGRRGEAQVQWRRALILNPEPVDAAKLQAKLAGPGAEPGPRSEPGPVAERRAE